MMIDKCERIFTTFELYRAPEVPHRARRLDPSEVEALVADYLYRLDSEVGHVLKHGGAGCGAPLTQSSARSPTNGAREADAARTARVS